MSLSAVDCRRDAFLTALDMAILYGEGSEFYDSSLVSLCEFVITADDASAVAAWSIYLRDNANSDGSVS